MNKNEKKVKGFKIKKMNVVFTISIIIMMAIFIRIVSIIEDGKELIKSEKLLNPIENMVEIDMDLSENYMGSMVFLMKSWDSPGEDSLLSFYKDSFAVSNTAKNQIKKGDTSLAIMELRNQEKIMKAMGVLGGNEEVVEIFRKKYSTDKEEAIKLHNEFAIAPIRKDTYISSVLHFFLMVLIALLSLFYVAIM